MKKMLVLLLVLLFVFSLAGCGVKEKIEQKVGEKIAEKVIESASGDSDTKVDIDGGKITIKDKDGGEINIGGTDWPKTDIPEFKGGTISGVVDNGDGSGMIIVDEVEKKDFENYCDDIKKDFTENVFEMTAEDAITFGSENAKGFLVQLSYDIEGKTLTIVTAKNN